MIKIQNENDVDLTWVKQDGFKKYNKLIVMCLLIKLNGWWCMGVDGCWLEGYFKNSHFSYSGLHVG